MAKRTHLQIAADAKEVVNDPARYADEPKKRLLAWAILMGQRGKRVSQARLSEMQGCGTAPRSHAIEISDARLADCLARTSPQ